MNKPKTIRTKVGWQHCKKCNTVISNRTAKALGGLCAHCWATTMAQYIEIGIKHMVVAVVILAGTNAWAVEVDRERLADAIYIAEGGSATRHPYGILTKYKTTTPRQACINSIKSAEKRYIGNSVEGLIAEMGRVYCPVNCENDNGTNQYWVKNVIYWYNKGAK